MPSVGDSKSTRYEADIIRLREIVDGLEQRRADLGMLDDMDSIKAELNQLRAERENVQKVHADIISNAKDEALRLLDDARIRLSNDAMKFEAHCKDRMDIIERKTTEINEIYEDWTRKRAQSIRELNLILAASENFITSAKGWQKDLASFLNSVMASL